MTLRLHHDPGALRDRYQHADPFPHVVLDGVFDDADLGRVLADFPKPEETRWMRFDSPLDRRINMLVYMNEGWREEWGGHLELWNADMTACRQRILPTLNRTVIFSTTDTSFHGHPHPLTSPPGMTRKSISLYYYTAGRPDEERSPAHDTIFREPQSPHSRQR